jgi:omega-amidase
MGSCLDPKTAFPELRFALGSASAMKVFCVQLDIVWEDKPANYARVSALLERTAVPAGSLVVLPEMFATGFSLNAAVATEETPSKSEAFLQKLALAKRSFVVAGLVNTTHDGRAWNQAVIISPEGQRLGCYRKIHPFTLGGESACYTAGSELVSFKWEGLTVAPFICYDLRFPEVFRSAVRSGAQLYTVIANWPVKRQNHWLTLLQARAIENQAYVVGVNRCGVDPKYTYSGRSLVVDPHGTVLVDAGTEEGVVSADVDLGVVETWRKDFPALHDMHWHGE